jgi:hypothetical protein
MHTFDDLVKAYRKQVRLPWREDVPASGRVWMLWYDRSLEGRVAGQWDQFAHETHAADHGWQSLDAGTLFAAWLEASGFEDALLEEPEELKTVLPRFETHVANWLGEAVDAAGPNDVVALKRSGALFGLARLSRAVEAVEGRLKGRLLLSFAGRYDGTGYRLLDARPGWNYHAIPIPSEPA